MIIFNGRIPELHFGSGFLARQLLPLVSVVFCFLAGCGLCGLPSTNVSLLASTFAGGAGMDHGRDVAVGPDGTVYVAGYAEPGFPVRNGWRNWSAGGLDAVVARFDPSLSRLLSATYIGGVSHDYAYLLAVDGIGHVYIAGDTCSSDFPGLSVANPDAEKAGDVCRIFIARFSSDLSEMEGCLTFSATAGSDTRCAYCLRLDPSGNPVLGGCIDNLLPAGTPGYPYAGFGGGKTDGFVLRANAELNSILGSIYLGGRADDCVCALDFLSDGSILAAGRTFSPDFTTAGGFHDTYEGEGDAFVCLVNTGLEDVSSSTLLGGSGYDCIRDVAVSGSGRVYVVGRTSSRDFPVTAGAYDTSYNGGGDVYGDILAACISQNLDVLMQATYVGGGSNDMANAVLLDSAGDVLVGGYTYSPDFPATAGAFDSRLRGDIDAVLCRFSSDLSTLLDATFLGGVYSEYCKALVFGPDGGVYLAGYTHSPDYPVTASSYEGSFGGVADFVLSLVDRDLAGVLDAPALVAASDGEYTDRVLIEWTGVDGADAYQVWRSMTNSITHAECIAIISDREFSDVTALSAVTYYYWIRASHEGTAGSIGVPDPGSRSCVGAPLPVSVVSASDLAFSDRIHVSWTGSVVAEGYNIHRSRVDDFAGSALLAGGMIATNHEDCSVEPGACYYYWIVATNAHGMSGVAGCDEGSTIPASSPVYRLYGRGQFGGTMEHLWTADPAERDVLAATGFWTTEGIGWYAFTNRFNGSVPLYRLYSSDAGRHYFTVDFDEYVLLTREAAWSGEGTACFVPGTDRFSCVLPVYRFYNSSINAHHYTCDIAETCSILSNTEWGYVYEGVPFYVFDPAGRSR